MVKCEVKTKTSSYQPQICNQLQMKTTKEYCKVGIHLTIE